jgi:hypothetical protein
VVLNMYLCTLSLTRKNTRALHRKWNNVLFIEKGHYYPKFLLKDQIHIEHHYNQKTIFQLFSSWHNISIMLYNMLFWFRYQNFDGSTTLSKATMHTCLDFGGNFGTGNTYLLIDGFSINSATHILRGKLQSNNTHHTRGHLKKQI